MGSAGTHPSSSEPSLSPVVGWFLLVLFMPSHTYFLIGQYFQNVFMLDTVQWPCTILFNFICIINTFSITFFSLDVQQYRIWNPWFVVFSNFLPWPISSCQYDGIGHGVGNSGTYIPLFYFWYTDPVAANKLQSIEKNKMYKHRKVKSLCFLRQCMYNWFKIICMYLKYDLKKNPPMWPPAGI